MRTAIASADGVRTFDQFGRSPAFAILDVDSLRVIHRTMRPNDFTPHARRSVGHIHGEGRCTHNHHAVVEALRDCQAVISPGMGRRAAEIRMIVRDEVKVGRAIQNDLAGTLRDRFDRLHDHHQH